MDSGSQDTSVTGSQSLRFSFSPNTFGFLTDEYLCPFRIRVKSLLFLRSGGASGGLCLHVVWSIASRFIAESPGEPAQTLKTRLAVTYIVHHCTTSRVFVAPARV